jgi:hypothetical protein
LANLFSTILDIETRLFQPMEHKGGVSFHGLFRLVDSRHGALVGSPAHPLGFFDVIADAALCAGKITAALPAPAAPQATHRSWWRRLAG